MISFKVFFKLDSKKFQKWTKINVQNQEILK